MAGVVSLTALVLLTACERRDAARPGNPGARAAAPAAVGAAELAAYGLGRRREIVLTEAALRLLHCAASADEHAVVQAASESDRIAADGARAAGLGTGQYQQLVARMDSLLIARGGERGAAGAGVPGASEPEPLPTGIAVLLDSLRVELVVARERLAAEASQPFRGASNPHRDAC